MTVNLELGESKGTVSGNGLSTKEETEAKITIQAPEGAEVYQDNLYMGIAPVTYKKTAGDHVITLRKEGYITRSHDINVPDDDKDVMYSFPDLEPESSEGSSGTVSGNTVSGNTVNRSSNDSNSQDSQTSDTVSGNTVSGNTVSDNTTGDKTEDVEKKGN